MLFQLWKRTGGGDDFIFDVEAKVNINTANIAINTGDIAALKQTFSWKTVPTDEEIKIGVNQQMIVVDGININGTLVIDGELSLI